MLTREESERSILDLLNTIDNRTSGVTPGPWFRWTRSGDVSSKPEDCILFNHRGFIPCVDDENGKMIEAASCTPQGIADCEFVCSARTDVPTLAMALREAVRFITDLAKGGFANAALELEGIEKILSERKYRP